MLWNFRSVIRLDPPSPLGKGELEQIQCSHIKISTKTQSPPYQGGFRGIEPKLQTLFIAIQRVSRRPKRGRIGA